MAASCELVCCGEERDADKAAIVCFSNGNVTNGDRLDFTMYKNLDEKNPRKKNQRILVAESERLSYVGQNFGVQSLKCNSLCQYYVGVLNRDTMQMELHTAQLFNMQPAILREKTVSERPEDTALSYRDKVDSLIEAFGTNKQKRALSARKLNQVGSDTLHHSVTQAASTVIEQKGLEALKQELADAESQGDVALNLPPCNPDATRREDVYPFEKLLTPVEFDALEQEGSKMAGLNQEELQKLKSEAGYLCVVPHLESLPASAEQREKVARCAFYLSLLLKLVREKSISHKFCVGDGCPRIIVNKLLKEFTVESFRGGRILNVVSGSMKAKLAAHCVALLLHMGDMTVDLTLLHRDLRITEARMTEVAKSMGLTLIKVARGKKPEAELQDNHKQATLVLPLVKYDQFSERRKRRKMR